MAKEHFYEIHPYCEFIPEIDETVLDELAENIKQQGLNDPIVLFGGKILDGRSRYAACKKAEVTPKFVDFAAVCPAVNKADSQDEKDKIAFDWVISHNVHRRHWSSSQRAMVLAKITTFSPGNPNFTAVKGDMPSITQKEAAEKAGVSTVLLSHATKVLNEAPEMVSEIESGKLTVSKAVNEIKEQKSHEPKESKSPFAKAVIDGTHTGKAFRKKVGELSKLVEQCTIAVPIVEYVGVCSTLESLQNIVDGVKGLPKFVQMKDLEKRIVSLTKEKEELYEEIADVIVFGSKTFHEWRDSLKQMAATDEEKSLLSAAEDLFKEHWAQVKSDLSQSKKVNYSLVEVKVKQVLGKEYMVDLEFETVLEKAKNNK